MSTQEDPKNSGPGAAPTGPTPEDLQRNLQADLTAVTGHGTKLRYAGDMGHRAEAGWPAAIRRAIAAEAEVERLREENRRLIEGLQHCLGMPLEPPPPAAKEEPYDEAVFDWREDPRPPPR